MSGYTHEWLAERVAANPQLKISGDSGPSRVPIPETATVVSSEPESFTEGLFLQIPGPPVAKPRQTQSDKWKQRPCVMKYREWADRAREVLGTKIGATKLSTAKTLNVSAYFPMPSSWSAKKRAEMRGAPHRQKPDGDNTLKAVADALIVHDETIYRKEIYKEWAIEGKERVEVYIQP